MIEISEVEEMPESIRAWNMMPPDPAYLEMWNAIESGDCGWLDEEEESAGGTAYTLRPMSALLDTPFPKWIINGMIPETGVGSIFGASGSGKTFLALDMAVAIASGSEWFGVKVKQRPVVYLPLEGVIGIGSRAKALAKKRGGLPEGLSILQEADGFGLSDEVALEHLIAAVPQGAVVIVDTLAQAMAGMDENSSVDMGLASKALKRLSDARQCVVIAIHHTGKDATKGERGHSSLRGALDFSISVARGEGSSDVRHWKLSKSKDGQDGVKREFKLQSVEIGEDDEGQAHHSCVVQQTEESNGEVKAPCTDRDVVKATIDGMLRNPSALLVGKRIGLYEGATAVLRDDARQECLAALKKRDEEKGSGRDDKLRDGAFRQALCRLSSSDGKTGVFRSERHEKVEYLTASANRKKSA